MSKQHSSILFKILFIVSALSLASCGGGGGGDSASPAGGSGATGVTISGGAVKGPIDGATITAYAIDANGNKGEEIGSAGVAGGVYSLSLGTYRGAVLLEVTGGSYTDEATLAFTTLNIPLRAVITNVSNGSKLSVSPLTELAVRYMGSSYSISSINDANALVSEMFGGSDPASLIDIIKTQIPNPNSDITSSSLSEKNYALLLAMISKYLDNTGNDLSTALAQFANEMDAGEVLNPETRFDLSSALNDFLTAPNNQTGEETTDLDDVVESGGNNPPVAEDAILNVAFNTAGSVMLQASDVNGDKLVYSFYTGEVPVERAIEGELIEKTIKTIIDPKVKFTTAKKVLAENVSINPTTGEFSYIPNNDPSGTRNYQYKVTDTAGNIGVGNITFTIAEPAANSIPVANAVPLTVLFATPTAGTLNGTDADGDALTYSAAPQTGHLVRDENGVGFFLSVRETGEVTVTNTSTGAFSYDPAKNFGTTEGQYLVSDAQDTSAPGYIYINILGGNSVAGGTLFGGTCLSCHASIAGTPSAPKFNASAGTIKAAINGGVPQMAGLPYSDEELSNISTWLNGVNTGDANRGAGLYQVCMGCHAAPSGPFSSPKAGRSAAQIQDAIRSIPQMSANGNVTALSIQQLEDIAAWLALPPPS